MKLRETLASMRHASTNWHPFRLLAFGYGVYAAVTWIVLCLPICHASGFVPVLDNLFIAMSAITTTGLITVNTPDAYSLSGQVVILIGIQLGGLGYMTVGSFILLSNKQPLSEVREHIGRTVFSLPEGYSVRSFVMRVIGFTAVIEILGAVALYYAFRNAGIADPLWPAIFHSISSFCTAGFSTFPNSLENFAGDFWVNAIVSGLSIAGAIGFLVFDDVLLTTIGRRKSITLTTRVILAVTFWSAMIGTLLILLMEPALDTMSLNEKLLVAGFQSMTALTTVGFDTVPTGTLHMAPTMVIIMLMLMGASPAGTGGGIKSTSVSATIALVMSTLRGSLRVSYRGVDIPLHRLRTAIANVIFYLWIFVCGTTLLLLVQPQSFEDLMFEAASALGTVGLSRGITADLSAVGKLIVIVLMFIGRVGPLTLGMAMLMSPKNTPAKEDIVV